MEAIDADEFKVFDDYNSLMVKEAMRDESQMTRRLKIAKKLLTRRRFQALKDEIEESCHAFSFRFVRRPNGRTRLQMCDSMPSLKEFHAYQDTICEGDSHVGMVAFPIKAGFWLEWHFQD